MPVVAVFNLRSRKWSSWVLLCVFESVEVEGGDWGGGKMYCAEGPTAESAGYRAYGLKVGWGKAICGDCRGGGGDDK